MAYVPPHKRGSTEGRSKSEQEESRCRACSNVDIARSSLKPKYARSSYDSNGQLPPIFDEINFYSCINLAERPDKWRAFQKRAAYVHPNFAKLVKRFDAVNGKQMLSEGRYDENYVKLDWDASLNAKYSPKIRPGPKTMTAGEVGCALSHVELWKTLASQESSPETNAVMMVLEDDAVFSSAGGKNRFAEVLTQAMKSLPSEWDMLYLGFSSRGERQYLETKTTKEKPPESQYTVELYQPEYGYHTHAYLITKRAALTLLDNLPVQGPIDVWLADNKWFDLAVFSAVIANEGWKREDGTFEGGVLVSQDRGHGNRSDVRQSCYSSKDPTNKYVNATR